MKQSMNDFNAYRDPWFETGPGVWRDGPTLVMARSAGLPFRCVRCNAPARSRLRMILAWYPPSLYWLLLIGFLPGFVIFIVVVALVNREVEIAVPLCQEHRNRRRRGIMIGWICGLSGILLVGVSFGNGARVFWLLTAASLCFVGLVVGVIRSQVVTTRKISKNHVWIDKVCPEYLDTLPDLRTWEGATEKSKPLPFDDEL